jgi:phospholipid/cholesterol/gamma-HCH transport system ATP-binding protein
LTDTPETQTPIVEIDGLTMQFGAQTVLREITLSLGRGETVAVIGESGCGKTVLLKTIVGLLKPTVGQIRFDGKDLNKLAGDDLVKARMRMGFVFQNAGLFDSMTIGQNVAFPIRQHTKMPDEEVREVVLRRLAEVGLPESVVPKKPVEISGGMRKRVGLARALVMEPELILYDEPTTGLDPIMSDVINELMIRTRDQHPVTSVIVTHDMLTAHKVADRVIMVYPVARLADTEPQVLYDGPPVGLEDSDDPRVVQFVLGEAGERLMELRGE